MDSVLGRRGAHQAAYQYVRAHGPDVTQKKIKVIYSTHGEGDQEVGHFVQHLKNACLEMLKSVCLYLPRFLQCF